MGKTIAQVVRGVEEKKYLPMEGNDLIMRTANAFGQKVVDGYNSLASAEVVVDRYELARTRFKGITKKTWDSLPIFHEDKKEIEAIATAIESGTVISIKKEG